MAGLSKKAKEATKKLKVFNDKLFDCNAHLCDKSKPQELREASSIFLTEGNSAAGSITKIRDVKTQAVYALRGKVLNVYKKTKAKAYETEELVSLVAALDVDDDIEKLRYNKIIIATDADDDGKHTRLLLITFSLVLPKADQDRSCLCLGNSFVQGTQQEKRTQEEFIQKRQRHILLQ